VCGVLPLSGLRRGSHVADDPLTHCGVFRGAGRRNHSVEARWSTVGYGQVTSISKGLLTGPAIGLDMSAPVAVPVIL